MSPETLTGADPLNCSSPEVIDITAPDPVSEQVGRPGFISNLTVDGCLIPSERGGHEPAVFDRCYWAADGEEPVLVDALSGGSKYEVEGQEIDHHVPLKRSYCDENGIAYLVFVDPAAGEFS